MSILRQLTHKPSAYRDSTERYVPRRWWRAVTSAVPIVLGVAAVVAFTVGLVLLAMAASRTECEHTTAAMQLDSRWGVWTGCLVEVDGEWLPLDLYRENREVQR